MSPTPPLTHSTPVPFTLSVADETLSDLQRRLQQTRWPSPSPYAGWQQGSPLAAVQAMATYWQQQYDWRTHEAQINRWSHFKVDLSGLELHYIHARSPHLGARPLLIQHGWPGSFYEFDQLLPRLLDPVSYGGRAEDAFHVVIPSLPGYIFSAAADTPGMEPARIAQYCLHLMQHVLGYPRFALQGGDWGSVVTSAMARQAPAAVLGLHLNMQGYRANLSHEGSAPLDDEERAFLQAAQRVMRAEMAYFRIQGTKPQSLGYGMTDSPVALMAWLLEKFTTWTDCQDDLSQALSADRFLTNVMLYWITGTMTSAMRLYYEHTHGEQGVLPPGERIEVPTGMAVFPGEILTPPRQWVSRAYHITHWQHMPRGGHFAAMEQPQLLAEDIWQFFRLIRN